MPSGFFSAVVNRRDVLTNEITSFELVPETGETLPAFTAGAHINIETPNGLIRTYSLNNDEAEGDRYVIAVKREDGGRGGSLSLHKDLVTGARVRISPPTNSLQLVPAQEYLLIAGGIGITPIISIARKLLREGHPNWRVLYLARNSEAAAYSAECQSAEFQDRVLPHYSDVSGIFDLWPYLDAEQDKHLYYCGPRVLMDSIYALTVHWPRSRVHYEEFAGTVSNVGNQPFNVRRHATGELIDIPSDRTILEVFREKGYNPKSSCETGTCRTCVVPLIGGHADHRDLCLSQDERHSLFAPCVSRTFGNEITLDM